MQSVDTQYDIENFLTTRIKAWACLEEFTTCDSLVHPILYDGFKFQHNIGWEALLYGFVDSRILTFQ